MLPILHLFNCKCLNYHSIFNVVLAQLLDGLLLLLYPVAYVPAFVLYHFIFELKCTDF